MTLILRETLNAFRRAPLLSALSITTIAFSLFVFGLFALVAINLHYAMGSVAERVEIIAYLKRGTPLEALTQAMADISAIPQVESVKHVSEDEALTRARRELREFQDIFQALESNPLPASLEIRLKPQYRDAQSAAAVAEMLSKGFPFIDDVRYGRDWVEKLDRLRNIAGAVGFVIGAAFAMVSMIIIGTTIRMAVLQRANEIAIMRLVGATDGFIRLPFILEGLLKGAIGGLLALALAWGVYELINSNFSFSALFFTSGQALVGVAAGGVIGLLGSLVSVGRHLRNV